MPACKNHPESLEEQDSSGISIAFIVTLQEEYCFKEHSGTFKCPPIYCSSLLLVGKFYPLKQPQEDLNRRNKSHFSFISFTSLWNLSFYFRAKYGFR